MIQRRAEIAMPPAQYRAEMLVFAMTAAAAFQARGFQWVGSDSGHVPDVPDLVRSLSERIESIVERGGNCGSSSGRLWVAGGGEDGDVEVWLNIGTLEGFFATEACEECAGSRYLDLDGDAPCPACEGSGRQIRTTVVEKAAVDA